VREERRKSFFISLSQLGSRATLALFVKNDFRQETTVSS
jgi:hypothetical protein